jgi:hypothetical protein
MPMSTGNDQLRTELEQKFQPPIDVLIDPSLLVASRTLEQLADSKVFASQTQATLGRTPTKPRLGDLYVPAAFRETISGQQQSTAPKTDVWDFYRGQAETAFPDDVVDLLDKNEVNDVSADELSIELQWENAIRDSTRKERLLRILGQEVSFLQSGGLVLSRTTAALNAFRDAGVPVIDIGTAELDPELRETLADIGYTTPAGICSFGVSTAGSTTDALVGDVLADNSDLLLYRIGN